MLEYCYLNKNNKQDLSGKWLKENFKIFTPYNIVRFIHIYILPKFKRDIKAKQFTRNNKNFLNYTVNIYN